MAQATSIELPPTLDMAYAEPLRIQLINSIHMGETLLLDGHNVSEVSTACLQVILSVSAKVKNFNGVFQVMNPSSVLVSALHDLGLEGFLEIEGVS